MKAIPLMLLSFLALFVSGCASQGNPADDYRRTHQPVPSTSTPNSPHAADWTPPSGRPGDFYLPPGIPPSRPGNHPEWRFKSGHGWNYIVIHHSATNEGSAASFDEYHRSVKHWVNGLGYDFVIDNGHLTHDGAFTPSRNGTIEVGPRWIKQITGAHAGTDKSNKYNEEGIGICLVGDFNKTAPTAEQMAALIELIRWLQKEYDIPQKNVIGHRDVPWASTDCPGRNFPMSRVKAMLMP